MTTSHDDYVIDVPYTWHFFEFQSPVLLDAMARQRGIIRPSLDEPFTYCELGCGNGMTSNLLAASMPQGEFYAIDFNPEHIANAQQLGQRSELKNVHYLAYSFETMLAKQDELPKFDFITLHGVYSWVSADIREQILEIIQHFLKPHGIVYVSYNPMPYWSDIVPMWHMMLAHTENMAADSLTRAKTGLEHLKQLRDSGLLFFRNHPSASQFLDILLERDIHFVAHEFCNNHLEPQYFKDVAQAMSKLELTYIGNATRRDEQTYLPKALQDYVQDSDDFLEQATRHSLVSNEFFRRDIYIKTSADTAYSDVNDSVKQLWVGSYYSSLQVHRLFPVYQDCAELKDPIYKLIMPLAFEGLRSIEMICAEPVLADFDQDEVIQAIQILIKTKHLVFLTQAAQTSNNDIAIEQLKIETPINHYNLTQRLMKDGECSLVSPILGSAMTLSIIEGLCLLSLIECADDHVQYLQTQLASISHHYPGDIVLTKQGSVEATWCAQKLDHFTTHILPALIRYRIISTS